MAISVYKTFAAGEVLTAADLNSSFLQIINNPVDLWSPAAKAADMNGFELILDTDADSSLTADTDDRLDVRLSGTDLFRFDGTVVSPVNGLNFIVGASGTRAIIDAGITGADANIGFTLLANGTGPIVIDNDTDPVDLRLLGAAAGYNNVVTDVNGNELLRLQGVASAVAQLDILNAATGAGPTIAAQGETNTPLNINAAGTGAVNFRSSAVVFGNTEVVVNEQQADMDFRCESDLNANAILVDASSFGGQGSIGIGGTTTSEALIVMRSPAVTAPGSTNFYRCLIYNGDGAATIPTGVASLAVSLNINEPNLTATGTITTACTVRIVDAPTEGGSNYALLVDEGRVRFDEALEVRGAAPVTPVADALYADSMVKAWVRITVTTGVPAINDDFNIASVDDDGVGDIGINFATTLDSGNFSVAGMTSDNNRMVLCDVQSTAAVDIRTIRLTDQTDQDISGQIWVIVVGD